MAVACAGVPQAPASHQQAAAHEQQQSFTPESRAPACTVDMSAEEPASAEEASIIEVDATSATIDSTAEQSSQQQQVNFAFELCADQICLPCTSCWLLLDGIMDCIGNSQCLDLTIVTPVRMFLQSACLSPERQHDQHKRWQLPGLTGSDAIKPEEWQNFCTKVEPPLPLGELQQFTVDAELP